MQRRLIKTSKFLSFVLRHKPEAIGISLDEEGWVSIRELLKACASSGRPITLDELNAVVEDNDKQRFVIRGSRIRANQGHSIPIKLGLEPREPPNLLFHGTTKRLMPSIREFGLMKMKRQHVHLSPDEQTAIKVGRRHGKPVVLLIDSSAMHSSGLPFYLSDNGVWLTDAVPWQYIREPDDES